MYTKDIRTYIKPNIFFFFFLFVNIVIGVTNGVYQYDVHFDRKNNKKKKEEVFTMNSADAKKKKSFTSFTQNTRGKTFFCFWRQNKRNALTFRWNDDKNGEKWLVIMNFVNIYGFIFIVLTIFVNVFNVSFSWMIKFFFLFFCYLYRFISINIFFCR